LTGRKPATWIVDLSLFSITLIWGSTFVLVKQALADVSTLLFLTLRFAAATLILLIVFRKEFRAANRWLSIRGGALAGLFLFSGYVLQTFGLKYTSASNAGFITGLYVPLVPLISGLVYKKPSQPSELLGVATAFVGLALMSVRKDLLDIGFGDLLIAACALAYAFHIVVLGRFAASGNSGLLTVTQIGTGMLLGAGTFWWAEPVHIAWSGTVWIALAVTSILATALAFFVQTWAQRWISPTRTALISSMEPVFAWGTSYVLAGEVLSRRGMLGAGLILAGILLVELKPFPPRRFSSA
jgi:drug/metabolite transporter (DMT)-like permease